MENIIYTLPLNEFTDIIKKCIREELLMNQPKRVDEELIKVEEAVKLLQVSKMTLFKWRKQGVLPFYRISSRIYFKKSELLDAIKVSPKYNRKMQNK